MNNSIAPFLLALSLFVSASYASAQTDPYFATGEDLEFITEADNSFALQEIEYKLRRFVIFRKIEDYFFSLSDTYFESEN